MSENGKKVSDTPTLPPRPSPSISVHLRPSPQALSCPLSPSYAPPTPHPPPTHHQGQPTKSEAAAAVKAVGLGKDATPEDIKEALAEELLPPKSKAYYRKQANSAMGTGKGTDKGTSKVYFAPEICPRRMP